MPAPGRLQGGGVQPAVGVDPQVPGPGLVGGVPPRGVQHRRVLGQQILGVAASWRESSRVSFFASHASPASSWARGSAHREDATA
jgi:hypothetical protein